MTIQTIQPASLSDALEPEYGTRAAALAKAYSRFCEHGSRARFNAEVQAIHSCVLIDFIEHSREARRGA